MSRETLTRRILDLLMRSERPLTVPEIAERLGEDSKRISGVISKMFEAGQVKASQIITTMVLERTRDGWKYSRRKMRYYTWPGGPDTYTVKIQRFDRRLNKNVEEEVVLVFKSYGEADREKRTDVALKVYEYLKGVDVAKFSDEIAEELGLDRGSVRGCLLYTSPSPRD